MTSTTSLVRYDGAPVDVRPDIVAAHQHVWDRLAEPGTWLTGQERRAVAEAARVAPGCELCQERKTAVSPSSIDGSHDGASSLPAELVDAVHRIVTDPARLTERLLVDLAVTGIDRRCYTEALGVTVRVVAIDSFCRAVGQPVHDLPPASDGEPAQTEPTSLDDIGAWVPVISLDDPTVHRLYGRVVRVSNVARALSLVPEETRDQVMLVEAMYLPLRDLASTGNAGRAIARAQMELIAAKISTLNECFY